MMKSSKEANPRFYLKKSEGANHRTLIVCGGVRRELTLDPRELTLS